MSMIKQPTSNLQQMVRGDRLFTSSDDNVMLKQIQGTHSPDGREVDVKPVLYIVEDIFNRASPSIDAMVKPGVQTPVNALDEKTAFHGSFVSTLESLAYVIDRISCEMACKGAGGGDAHSTTISILNLISNYSWDAKLVLALAAFAVNYGEFWLVAQNYSSNQLAKSVAILKQLPELLEHTSTLKIRFDAIKVLIKAMLDVTKCIVRFKELPSQYISADIPALSTALAHIPIAVYWTIRSIVACASQIASLTGLGHENIVSTTEAWELSSLAHKVTNIHNHLLSQLETCDKHIDERKQHEAYQNLLHLFETMHIDNMKVLKALIYPRDDMQPLVDGATKRRVNIEVLRGKNVLLLISDLDISPDELSILEQIYNESRQPASKVDSQYEVVWFPIIDPSVPLIESWQNQQFEALLASMPWYSVYHPSIIQREVIKFIKEVWNFRKKPILVVLDPQGRVVSPNALHMMWIWGSLAFPFTSSREEALWKEETWKLELLVDAIDPQILNWISEGRFICLYGGEDIDWIRKFTNTARGMAQAAGISLGMVYVGKSNPKVRVKRNTATISTEKLSHFWQDLASVWYFWVRIESMWQSKMQLGKTPENDPIMLEIVSMLSFDSSEGGWALLSRGSAEMTKAKGSAFLTCLQEYDKWKELAQEMGVVPAIDDRLKQLHTPHHCNRLVLPGTAGKIPERVVCSECGRMMERFIMYQCCDE